MPSLDEKHVETAIVRLTAKMKVQPDERHWSAECLQSLVDTCEVSGSDFVYDLSDGDTDAELSNWISRCGDFLSVVCSLLLF
jgi:hypothetical protein